jgi:homospermidine synthase
VEILVKNKKLCIDVSIGIDAVEIMKICDRANVIYVNTSLENWEIEHPEVLGGDLYKRTLHSQFMKVRHELGKTKTTMIFDHGMNPGMISHFAKRGINDAYAFYCRREGKDQVKLEHREDFQKAAHELGIVSIHIAEFDSQRAKILLKENTFYNTWSCYGLIAEALDSIQVGYNEDDKQLAALDEDPLEPPRDGENTRYYKIRGMDRKAESVYIRRNGMAMKYRGYMIPHGEANTISRYLRYEDHNPSVYYVYRPSEPAIRSLDWLKSQNYVFDKDRDSVHHVLRTHEVTEGIDSIGAFIVCKDFRWWAGTVVETKDLKKYKLQYGTPTSVQVAISLLAGIRWMLANPKRGLLSPEYLPHNQLIEWCEPYLGLVISKRI